MASLVSRPAAKSKTIPIHHVAAVVAGNALEFYDFLCYTIFAIYIGKAFFPAHGAGTSLLLSLATFWIGFLTRPIGAIVLGGVADRIGRKPSMVISFAMMGSGMAGVALTPTYAQIGLAAPILIILFRLIQGFALGGEVGPTTAYLIEAAPVRHRGFYGAMQATSQDFAVLVASLIGVALAAVLTTAQLEAWGWRIAFLVGLTILPFGLLVRRSLPETLHTADDAALAPDATTGVIHFAQGTRRYLRLAILGFIILIAGTIGTYTTDYMTTYSMDTLHLAANISFGVTVVTSLCSIIMECLSGYLSDRFGRRPIMIIPSLLVVPLIIPSFWLITHFPSRWTLYGAMGVLSSLAALSFTPFLVALTESLPARIRAQGLATIYAFAISIFGGSTQFVVKLLLRVTGNPMMPAYYWEIFAVISLFAMFLMKESAPVKLAATTEK